MDNAFLNLTEHLRQSWLGPLEDLTAHAEAAGTWDQLETILSQWAQEHAGDIARREVEALTAGGGGGLGEQSRGGAGGGSLGWVEG